MGRKLIYYLKQIMERLFSRDLMWDFVPKNVRKKHLHDDRFDGEFWMSFQDFYKEFEEVSLCMMGPDFDQDGIKDRVGQVRSFL